VRTFFREHTDESGVRVLTLKLSERLVCTKPSKNILKRWNLSNGMLYFFYAAVGRTAPPTGEEILEPFYCQKRVDFIRKVCGGREGGMEGGLGGGVVGEEVAASASGATAAGGFGGGEGGREGGLKRKAAGVGGGGGSHDFFALQEQLQQAGRSRKRRRESTEVPLPLSELYITAEPSLSPSLPRIKTEDGGGEGSEEGMIQSLVSYLKTHVWKGVEEGAVRAAVAAGIWRVVEEESVNPSLDPSLAYLSRPPRAFWVPSMALPPPPPEEGGGEGTQGGREEGVGGVVGWGW
jgi:hypothetical protein